MQLKVTNTEIGLKFKIFHKSGLQNYIIKFGKQKLFNFGNIKYNKGNFCLFRMIILNLTNFTYYC